MKRIALALFAIVATSTICLGQQSVVVNRKSQTPTVIPSETLENKWQRMKLSNNKELK